LLFVLLIAACKKDNPIDETNDDTIAPTNYIIDISSQWTVRTEWQLGAPYPYDDYFIIDTTVFYFEGDTSLNKLTVFDFDSISNYPSNHDYYKLRYLKKEYGILLSLYDNINATPILQKLATDNPAHAQYQYALLEHYYRHNQFKSYIQHASQFLRHNTPLFPQFYQILSKVYYKNQQPDIAKYYLSLYYLAVGKQSLAQRILTKLKAQNKVDIILLQKIKTVLDQITIKKGNPS